VHGGGVQAEPASRHLGRLELDEDLSLREEFSTREQQFAERPRLQAIFGRRFAANTTDYWVKALEGQDILCAPVRTLTEALSDEQIAVNKMILEMQHPTAGRVKALDAPIRLSEAPSNVRRVPPRLGEHNADVLKEHGYDDEAVAALTAAGVLR
jgi:crotonobetainyl-CoA:carnitine CoA-transferase CaiB-like acyl-CoA transferase